MARVDVTLQGRHIPVACADGQEDRVREVAAYVDRRMGHLRQALRGPSDIELLALTSIAMGDDLLSLQDGQGPGQAQAGEGPSDPPGSAASSTPEAGDSEHGHPVDTDDADALAHILETLAGRIEAVAARLEGA